jgi:3-oxochol-4-en-24-oyl-CoA dehydrogenase
MPIGMTDDQQSLAEAIGDWATGIGAAALVKASEEGGTEVWGPALTGLADLGVAGIAVPEDLGGAGGSLLDLAVAVEAAAYGMVPGGLLGTALASVVLAEHPDSATAKAVLPGIADGSVRIAWATRPTTLVEHEGTVTGVAPVVAGLGTATHLLAP